MDKKHLDKKHLIDLLLECPSLRNVETRHSLLTLLPPDIANQITASNIAKIHVLNIVNTCTVYPNGLKLLLDNVGFLDGESEPFQRLMKEFGSEDEPPSTQEIKEIQKNLTALMAQLNLSVQIKPSDEFIQHDSRELIQAAVAKVKRLQRHNHEYNQLVMKASSLLASTGNRHDFAEAEELLLQARKTAKKPADKALAAFNLFQVQLRRNAYSDALANLQTAIGINASRYALHDIDRYPIIRLLGAGGMGCAFLCQDQWRENKVVVKCFWEGYKGQREEVFGEAMKMRRIAGDYVPKPLDCGYVIRQERPYFVTEYLEGALDGDDWLAQHGLLDVPTGLTVGLQIAKGLQVAHNAGICHLDLKPANILLKSVSAVSISVKIIDFGLARVAKSLKQEAVSRRGSQNHTQFGQDIIAGTWDYASPEQLGYTDYGKPSIKSDLFSFGATLYRLMTLENPRHLNPRRLADAPELFELLCDCKEENPARRPEIAEVIARLTDLLGNRKKTPGELFSNRLKDGSEAPEMVIIPAGRFRMGDITGNGDDDEKPVHHVSVERFAMGRYPVTVSEFRSFVKATGYKTEAEKGDGAYVWKDDDWKKLKDANWRNPYLSQTDNHPVICVSWNDAVAYTEWLSKQTGQAYRLPTEAEWEYAARAGTETDYWWGNEIGENLANCYNSGSQWSNKSTSPVGSFKANPFGLFDTVGNVWEWCADNWHKNYEGAPTDGTVWKGGDESLRVLRGGSWGDDPVFCRTALRNRNNSSDVRNQVIGFRVAARL